MSLTKKEKATKTLEKKISKMWLDKITEASDELSIDLTDYKPRLKELSKMYADSTIFLYKNPKERVLAEDIREDYELAIEVFLKKVAKRQHKKLWNKFLWLLDKSKGLLLSLAIDLLKDTFNKKRP